MPLSTDEKRAAESIAAQSVSDNDEPGLDLEKVRIDGSPYPHGLELAALVFGLCLGNFVVALDTTIIATAVPQIVTDFSSLEDVGWYGSAYLLGTTVFQPSFGKIFKHFSMKLVYIICILIFEVGSIICATSKNSATFIVGRAVAGLGAAGLYQGALSIMGLSVPLRKKPVFIAMATSVFGIASCFGPVLGGVFTDKVGWRWCFWINLPVGAVAAVTAIFAISSPDRKEEKLTIREKVEELDYVGAFFLISSLICLFLALRFGGNEYKWSSSQVIGLFVGFGSLLIVFLGLQLKLGERATIPPQIIKQRTILSGCLYSFFLQLAIYVHSYYLPFYFQSAQNASAIQSGIRNIPYVAGITFFAIVGGALIVAVGYYMTILIIGTMIYAVGCGLLITLQVDSGAKEWVGYQLLCGLGAGIGIQVPFTALQVVLSSEDMPTGNAITVFLQQLGGAISVSMAQSIFTNNLSKNLRTSTSLDPALVIRAGATNLEKIAPPGPLLNLIILAYNKAIQTTFILPTVAACLAFISCLGFEPNKSIKAKKPATAEDRGKRKESP